MAAPDRVKNVCVVGGANVDIEGRADQATRPSDSVAGRIIKSSGGVGRNIAENLARLGVGVRLLTVLGDDSDGSWLRSEGLAAGIDMTCAVAVPGERTARYVSIVDGNGEVVAAVNDMAILERLDVETIERASDCLAGADAVVVDCNLAADPIEHLCSVVDAPVFLDPVSVTKAQRALPTLGQIHTIKPNRAEAAALTSSDTGTPAGLAEAADALLDAGVQNVVIGLGRDGAFFSDGQDAGFIRPRQVIPSSVTGAGDAQMAALVLAHLEGFGLGAAAGLSVEAAAITAKSSLTVSPELSRGILGLGGTIE